MTAKVEARNTLLKRLAGTTWGARFSTLRTSTLALAYSTAEYCAPVWCRSTHTKTLDVALNNSMRLISGCLRSTPAPYLPVLSGIMPPDLRRDQRCLQLAKRAESTNHLLHQRLHQADENTRLPSRSPLIPHLRDLSDRQGDRSVESWGMHEWGERWDVLDGSRLHHFMPEVSTHPLGNELDRRSWTRLNRLRSGQGRFRSLMYAWGFCASPICECGAPQQTVDHIIDHCPFHDCPGRNHIVEVTEDAVTWLRDTDVVI